MIVMRFLIRYTLTSLNKAQFYNLTKEIVVSPIRNTSIRSIRTAVACLLCKLWLDLSNTVLGLLFELPDKQAVSRVIESARKALLESFVSDHLEFSHINTEEKLILSCFRFGPILSHFKSISSDFGSKSI
ncbi:unnamed protein product [Didymodactylos carnosus]|uniref:Uncharacterized protein n=1 Tax=Didymodactylos carnosus TaxID=1234261 RepID=A0A815WX44_9BILA|nr:unnamed protein product [Didymodactylos carnosus]CAF1616912.1 unnamed protein product [Didymodactylos carnosus]CAF4410810.1 unnamed protein product [Didymodactylos carnosus]CAF4434084.1 unnamed protein product [Didymodactylos carnosus]